MSGKLRLPLSLNQLRLSPPTSLLEPVKTWMQASNAKCFLHPHGFWTVLLSRSETEEWRFHYWPKGPRTKTGMPAAIHNHDKVIESRVVLGELRNIEYQVENVETQGQPIYFVDYDGDKFSQKSNNILRDSGKRAVAIPLSEEIVRYGGRYRIEAHTYHEVIVAEDVITATICRMSSHVPGPVNVLGCPSFPEEVVIQRTSRPAVELAKMI